MSPSLSPNIFDLNDILNKSFSGYENFFKSIFNFSPSSLVLSNEDGEILFCNENAYSTLGCKSSPEFVSNFANLMPEFQPDGTPSKDSFEKYIKLALENGSVSHDFMHLTMNGTPLPAKIKTMKLDYLDKNGKIVLLTFITDISEFVKKQEAEHKFNQKMNAILDAAPLCVNLWDENLNNIMCNEQAVLLFNLKNRQDYLENHIKLSPKYQPDGRLSEISMKHHLLEAFRTGYVKFNWLYQDLEGEPIQAEVILNKIDIKDDNGREFVAGFTHDLRPWLAGTDTEITFDEYFLDEISDKRLFNALSELSDELYFAFDIRTSMIQYFGKGMELFGLTSDKLRFPAVLISRDRVHNDDLDDFLEIVDGMKTGVFKPADIRFKTSDGSYRYFRLIYRTIFDKNGNPTFSVGRAVDMHEQKALETRSKTDLLTKCYNKLTAETMISDIINQSASNNHALFIIDIDDFKAVNDNLGHYFGDMVLSDVAYNLRSCFRNADVVGRIGGDEFIVLLKDVDDMSIIKNKAEKIAHAFKHTYSGENNTYKISGSIGVSRFPLDGSTYEDLYKAADKALYQSKLQGKDCYTFYTKDLLDGTMKNRTVLENANRIANSYFDSELVSTVFNLLFEAKNINLALDAVMQFIGIRTNADRCYIFETFDGGDTYDNTHEWCNINITPEIDNLQGLTKEVLYDFFANANSDGIFYSNDLRDLKADGAYELMNEQGIKSFLHVQLYEKDYCKIFLGLDDCTNTRVWNEKEINSILYAAKMISIFLLSDSGKNRFDKK